MQHNTLTVHTGEPKPRGQGHRTRRHNTPSLHTGEREERGQGHRIRNTKHRASTPLNRSKVPQDTTHTTRRASTPVNRSQEAKGAAHTANRACTPVKGSQVAQVTAHATQHAEHTHRWTGAKWTRTPQTQQDTPSVHAGKQEPSGQGHRICNTTHRACTTVNQSQLAKDTAHATQYIERAHQ